MENELPPENLKSLWQNQSVEPVHMSLEEIRQKAEKFQKRIRNRNLREYAASGVVAGAFGYYLWKFPDLRLGSALVLAATLYVVYQLHSRGGARPVPMAMGLGTSLDFYRHELERQRDLLRGIWKWYLLPFVPGLIAFLAVPMLHSPVRLWVHALPFVVLSAGFFYAAWKVNLRAAEKLQRQIDELNSISG